MRSPGSQSEHSFRFIMFARDLAIYNEVSCWSPVPHRVYIGLLFLLLMMSEKDIDDAYHDSEYHAPNNVRHSDTTNYANIGPSTSRLKPLFQSEAKCEDIDIMKMSFYSHASKTNFHNKGFALGLGLKMERLVPVVRNPPDKSLSIGYSVDIAIHRLNSLIFNKGLKWYRVVFTCLVN